MTQLWEHVRRGDFGQISETRVLVPFSTLYSVFGASFVFWVQDGSLFSQLTGRNRAHFFFVTAMVVFDE